MENSANALKYEEDEIDLREIFSVLWKSRFEILLGLAFSLSIGFYLAVSLPDKYTSEALLAPRTDSSGSGSLGKLAAQYSGLAGLAGVNMGAYGQDNVTAEAIEILKSRSFFGKYLYDVLLVDLMAAESWDSETEELSLDANIFNEREGVWRGDVSGSSSGKPSVQSSHRVFINKALSVTENKATGFVTLEVTHISPIVARDWTNLLIRSINEAMRERDVTEAENSISFLNEQRLKTDLVSLDGVFSELIEQQTKTMMLASASDEYVFRIIEPPIAADTKSEPRRLLICFVAVGLGFLISIIFVLLKYAINGAIKKS